MESSLKPLTSEEALAKMKAEWEAFVADTHAKLDAFIRARDLARAQADGLTLK